MTENEPNIYSIAYRDCKEVAESIDVNEEYGKASTILFYMDEILEALKIAGELQAIGTIGEFKALKEKSVAKKPILNNPKINEFYIKEAKLCPACHSYINNCRGDYCRDCGQRIDFGKEE